MSDSFRFGEFELDVAAYALRRNGQRIKLEQAPMDLLVLLVRKAGRLVTRTDMQAALWGGDVFVDHDAAINTAIRKIRRALDDDAEQPDFVETVVGKGYRFVADAVGMSPNSLDHRLPTYLVTRGKQQFVLNTGENLLGRDPRATVYIEHPSVSRRHARISLDPTRAVLEDLESRNGTFVEGRKVDVDAPIEIHDGAIIGLGPIAMTFVVLPAFASTVRMTGGTTTRRTPRSRG